MSQNMAKKARIDNEKLKREVECPVCLGIPREGPVYACPNGHLVCQVCKGGTCPICREAMGQHRSLLAVAVIENILHKCKHEECKEEFKLENLLEHEKVCEHRIVCCPFDYCDDKFALSKLLDHLLASPCSVALDSMEDQPFMIHDIESLKKRRLVWQVRVGSHRDVKFALCVRKCGDYYHINIVMFESEEECSKYNIELEVFKSRSSPASRHGMKFRGNPTSIDETKTEMGNLGLAIHRDSMEKMVLEGEAMEKMVLEDETFSFSVSVSFL